MYDIDCPFTYANGKKCKGKVWRARAYGPHERNQGVERHRVKKYRLWCNEKDDHVGGIRNTYSQWGKWRMEFYPDQLPPGVEDALWASGILEA